MSARLVWGARPLETLTCQFACTAARQLVTPCPQHGIAVSRRTLDCRIATACMRAAGSNSCRLQVRAPLCKPLCPKALCMLTVQKLLRVVRMQPSLSSGKTEHAISASAVNKLYR